MKYETRDYAKGRSEGVLVKAKLFLFTLLYGLEMLCRSCNEF